MSFRLKSALLVIVLTGTVASVAGAEDSVTAPATLIAHPVWQRMPTGRDVASHYPEKALSAGLSGGAIVECKVTPKGRLQSCTLISETPEGYDFGKAVLKLAYFFKMAEVDGDGAPTTGRLVRLPLEFNLSGGTR